MDRLIKFCLPKDIQVWLDQYKAPKYESAFAKDIPNSLENHQMASRLAKVVKIRKKYRGGSWGGYSRVLIILIDPLGTRSPAKSKEL